MTICAQVALQCDTRGPSSILGRMADIADEADTETGKQSAKHTHEEETHSFSLRVTHEQTGGDRRRGKDRGRHSTSVSFQGKRCRDPGPVPWRHNVAA